MDTLPPYKITVYNRAAQREVGGYRSNQVPREGDLISFYGPRMPGDPFDLWGYWKVDEVVWLTSQAGSQNAIGLMRTHHSDGEAACLTVELHVWPAEGPHFADVPEWVRAAAPGHHEDEGVRP